MEANSDDQLKTWFDFSFWTGFGISSINATKQKRKISVLCTLDIDL